MLSLQSITAVISPPIGQMEQLFTPPCNGPNNATLLSPTFPLQTKWWQVEIAQNLAFTDVMPVQVLLSFIFLLHLSVTAQMVLSISALFLSPSMLSMYHSSLPMGK